MKKLLGLTIFLLSFNSLIYAQNDAFLQKYQERIAKNPKDLSFKLRLDENKKQFQQGEIILLELSFSSRSPDKFGFNTASYDRSGRLMIDGFVIDKPEGAVDPLNDYFTKGFSVFMIGGLHTTPMLGPKPQIINYELNEWLRFEKPGKYRLYISSGRVTIGKTYSEGSQAIAPVSNIVEFEIIPADKKWQQEKLTEIIKKLNPSLPEKTRKKACRELRFLGSKDAAKEIIQRFTDEDKTCDFSFYMGLQGSPERKFIVTEMERTMDKPDFPVSHGFLQNLALLSYFWDNPQPLQSYPNDTTGANRQAWEADYKLRQAQKQAEYDKYTDRLEIALKDKKGKALAISADTVFNFRDSEKSTGAIDALIKVFGDLPPERQQSLLAYSWEKIANQKLLPVLLEIYNRFDRRNSLNNEDQELVETAIKRIYELAPDEGRNLILSEMRRTDFRVSNGILLLLPDKEFSEFENEWLEKASRLDSSDSETYVKLLENYGTINVFPRLRAVYEEHVRQIPCSSQESLIRYFLKHDAVFGTEAVKKAMEERKKTGCYTSVFENIPKEYWSKELEQTALSYLDDENPRAVKEAVEGLGKNGSAGVKDKIWQRFKELSPQLRADETALKKTFDDYTIQTIERSFIQALNQSSNWKLTDEEKNQLKELCVSKSCRDALDNRVIVTGSN